jgi:hypothetical protein
MARISKGMMMTDNAPVIVHKPTILSLREETTAKEPDLDMLEIEEAKKHFEDQCAMEAFWAGRTLANRKSTRIAA